MICGNITIPECRLYSNEISKGNGIEYRVDEDCTNRRRPECLIFNGCLRHTLVNSSSYFGENRSEGL